MVDELALRLDQFLARLNSLDHTGNGDVRLGTSRAGPSRGAKILWENVRLLVSTGISVLTPPPTEQEEVEAKRAGSIARSGAVDFAGRHLPLVDVLRSLMFAILENEVGDWRGVLPAELVARIRSLRIELGYHQGAGEDSSASISPTADTRGAQGGPSAAQSRPRSLGAPVRLSCNILFPDRPGKTAMVARRAVPGGEEMVFTVHGKTRAYLASFVIEQPDQEHSWTALIRHGNSAGYWALTSPATLERTGRRIREVLPVEYRSRWQQSAQGVRWTSA